jgi:hypothetical protein
MLAKRLASLLTEESRKTDLSEKAFDDIAERFEKLRGFRLLPIGRTKNITHLTTAQIVAGILSIATAKPGYAGLAAKGAKRPLSRGRAGRVISAMRELWQGA